MLQQMSLRTALATPHLRCCLQLFALHELRNGFARSSAAEQHKYNLYYLVMRRYHQLGLHQLQWRQYHLLISLVHTQYKYNKIPILFPQLQLAQG